MADKGCKGLGWQSIAEIGVVPVGSAVIFARS